MSVKQQQHGYGLAHQARVNPGAFWIVLGMLCILPAAGSGNLAAQAFWGKSSPKVQLKTEKVTPKTTLAAAHKASPQTASLGSKTPVKKGEGSSKAGLLKAAQSKKFPLEKSRAEKPGMTGKSATLPFVIFPESPTTFTKPYLVRSVPLQVNALAPSLPEKFSQADEVMSALLSSPSLLVHMEALRRSQNSLGLEQQKRLLVLLNQRYQQNVHDANRYFDYGYGQLAITRNKTGLFFLRKANDQLHTQFTSLAYAMAEVDMDLDSEHSNPDQYTTRKLDVSYKIQDAVKRDAKNHQPGFWPSLTRVLLPLKTMPAYSDLAQADYSEAYVPYGNRSLVFTVRHPDKYAGKVPQQPSVKASVAAVIPPITEASGVLNNPKPVSPSSEAVPQVKNTGYKKHHPVFNQGRQFGLVTPEQAVLAQSPYPAIAQPIQPLAMLASVPATVEPEPLKSEPLKSLRPQKISQKHPLKGQTKSFSKLFPGEPLEISKQVDLIDNGSLQSVNFYRLNAPKGQNLFHMVVTDPGQRILADLQTPVAPYVMEDLDHDGIFELVIRQGKIQPFDPVLVYRYHPDEEQYVLDRSIQDLFR